MSTEPVDNSLPIGLTRNFNQIGIPCETSRKASTELENVAEAPVLALTQLSPTVQRTGAKHSQLSTLLEIDSPLAHLVSQLLHT